MTVDVDTRAWNALQAALKGFENKMVKVGILESKGGGDAENGLTLAEQGAVHEFGTASGSVPERRWIRGTFEQHEKELVEMQARLAKVFFRGELGVERALGLLGVWAANKVKYHVKNDALAPPLKAATIARKGSDRPLIDTGRMINSVNYEVATVSGESVGDFGT